MMVESENLKSLIRVYRDFTLCENTKEHFNHILQSIEREERYEKRKQILADIVKK